MASEAVVAPVTVIVTASLRSLRVRTDTIGLEQKRHRPQGRIRPVDDYSMCKTRQRECCCLLLLRQVLLNLQTAVFKRVTSAGSDPKLAHHTRAARAQIPARPWNPLTPGNCRNDLDEQIQHSPIRLFIRSPAKMSMAAPSTIAKMGLRAARAPIATQTFRLARSVNHTRRTSTRTSSTSAIPSSSSSTLPPTDSSASSSSRILTFPAREPLPRPHKCHVATLALHAHHPYNLDLYTSFALAAAHNMRMPTSGAAALPTTKSLWTVIKSPFVHKKAQENFERRTHRRIIKVYDTDRDTVDLWLRYLRKNGIGGVGMKAMVHEWVEYGFGRKEIEGLEKEWEEGMTAGDVEKAAEKLVKALSTDAASELQATAEASSEPAAAKETAPASPAGAVEPPSQQSSGSEEPPKSS